MKCETLKLKNRYAHLGRDGRDPSLDLYLPQNINGDEKRRPSMIVCPGGGYGFVSEREAEPIALKFLSDGFNVFVLRYSVAPHVFPTQLCEVAATMELIFENAAEWHCDTSKIAICGFSAGGHVAAHYSTSYDCAEVREYFPESKPVNATILSYAVISSDPAYTHEGSMKNLSGKETLDEKDRLRFSCDKNVSRLTPPAFIWHTAGDELVPVQNSLLYASALSEHDIPFELHVYPYGGHGLATVDAMTCGEIPNKVRPAQDWVQAARNWLKGMGFIPEY